MFNLYKDNFLSSQRPSSSTTTTTNDCDDYDEEELKPIRTKLYVTNFPQHCTRRQLTEFFSKFGNVLECAIMWDSYAFIHYASRKEASYALKQATGRTFMGNKLFIQLSISRHRQESNWYQKEVAKLQDQMFNSLIDENSPSPMLSAISLSSLANINETKLYITNLPDTCNHADLKSLFQKYGNVLECVVMWNQYAFVHYSDVNEARNALLGLHGQVFEGKNLIVQYSTSSNRPLPKCKAFDLNDKKQQNGIEFIKTFEKTTECRNQEPEQQQQPATILCYRASDLENEYGVKQQQQEANKNKVVEKDWIKILSTSIQEKQQENNNNTVSLSDIPTPSQPLMINKNTKKLSLDQIPTPPLPNEAPLPSSAGSSSSVKTRSSDSTSSSSSVDMSDYPISSSSQSHSVSPYTLSSLDDHEDLFNNTTELINSRKNDIENLSMIKKYSRSRCLLVNSILFSELKDKLCLN